MSAEGDGPSGPPGRPLHDALGAYLRSQGHGEVYVLGAVCACWEQVVGPDVASHVTPHALRGDELVVTADHAGWVTQLAFLADQVLGGLEAEIGRPVAARLKVTVRRRDRVE